jgi:hypothetical protein
VPSQGQLQTRRSVDTGDYSMDKHNIKSKTNYRQALKEKKYFKESEQTIKQTKMTSGNEHDIYELHNTEDYEYEQTLLTLLGC